MGAIPDDEADMLLVLRSSNDLFASAGAKLAPVAVVAAVEALARRSSSRGDDEKRDVSFALWL